jgi:hypothetical protein
MTRGSVVDVGVNRKAVWGGDVPRPMRLALALVLAALSASCGDMARQGTGSAFLIVNSIEAASGAEPNEFGGTLQSDVITFVDQSPTIFNDVARVRFILAMKDAGGTELPSSPTTNNFVTINRYRVEYVRADGRNTPGVDVPWPFDGAITMTVGGSEATGSFTIVRHQAKVEAPLGNLARNAVIISTIANVTFYGRDQTGREIITTAAITVDFGNFGDPG